MLLTNRSTIFPSTSVLCFKQFYYYDFGKSINNYSTKILKTSDHHRLRKCYEMLGLSVECTKDELKSRYVELAKKFHPDSNVADNNDDNAEKFRQIAEAYKFIIDNDCNVRDKENLENVPKIYDIRHTAPQHRQYLEYGGVGHGTPGQRLRQYQQHRVQQAVENVGDYTMRKFLDKEDYSLITKTNVDAEYARKWKTRNAIDRLVEDLIQESMKKGEFDNLAGFGKPLKHDSTHNPYVDSMTHKLNQILIQNGFTPEWVLLEKEINEQKRTIRKILKEKIRSFPSAFDWTASERKSWSNFLDEFNDTCTSLNKQIDHFNLVCPALSKQMVRFQLNREADKVIRDAGDSSQQTTEGRRSTNENIDRKDGETLKRKSKVFDGDNNDKERTAFGLLKNIFSAFNVMK